MYRLLIPVLALFAASGCVVVHASLPEELMDYVTVQVDDIRVGAICTHAGKAYSEGSTWNDAYWKHDRFNKLLLTARAELNQTKRREMYVEMQSIVRDEGGTVIPVFANWVFAMNKKVQHGEMAGNWDLDGAKGAERWWFA